MNYEELSDFEINKLVVAMFLGVEPRSTWIPALIPDYCNDPEHAWPIIVENKIDIEFPHEETNQVGFASNHLLGIVEEIMPNENPLRAAMIVYLMIQGVK